MAKILGYEIDQKNGVLSIPRSKAQDLRAALRYLASRATVNASALATLVGIWIWGALLRRDLLAIPRDVFKLLEKADGRTVTWWRVARQEVCTMAEAVIWMSADLNRPAPWPQWCSRRTHAVRRLETQGDSAWWPLTWAAW